MVKVSLALDVGLGDSIELGRGVVQRARCQVALLEPGDQIEAPFCVGARSEGTMTPG